MTEDEPMTSSPLPLSPRPGAHLLVGAVDGHVHACPHRNARSLDVFDAVEQAGTANGRATHFVIGVDSNQNGVKPGFVLTSMVKRVDNAVYDIVKEVVEGRFTGGFHVYGLESDGVGYVVDDFNRALVSPDAIAAAEEAKKKIIGGEIKVTDAMAQ